MSLDTLIEEIKTIKGFRAAGIMTYTGEMLASCSVDPKINLEILGATFNDIFRGGHEAAIKMGMGANEETLIMTPNGTVVMICSGVESKAHVHLIAIIDKEGNHALARMTLEKMAPRIVAELA